MTKNVKDGYDLGTAEWEDYIRAPLKLLKIAFCFYSIVCFLVPIYSGFSIGMNSFISFVCWVVMLSGCLSCHGRLFDFLPLTFIVGVRTLQVCFHIFIQHGQMNWITTAIVFIVEFVVNMLYMNDKSTYTYIKEEEFKNEYY